MQKRKLKTQNANRNSIEVKVTLKPEQCKLMDSAIQILFGDEMSRSQFMKICLNEKLRKVTLISMLFLLAFCVLSLRFCILESLIIFVFIGLAIS